MAEDAYLLQAFINIALIPDGKLISTMCAHIDLNKRKHSSAGSAYFLVRQVGYSKALEISLSGKPIKAAECLQLGLANKV